MNTCKYCKNQIKESDINCPTCHYPLKSSEKEQAVFIANHVMNKGDVKESVGILKKARYILWGISAYLIIIPLLNILVQNHDLLSFASQITTILIGGVFVIFAIRSYKRPKSSLLIPLIVISLYYLILLLVSPFLVYQGIIWKIVIISGLSYGYFSVKRSNKLLAENKYLASQVGFEKVK